MENVGDTVARLCAYSAELIGEVVQDEDVHSLGYLHVSPGIIVALAEELS